MAEASDRDAGLTLTTVIPWVLTLLTAVFGIWQFTAQQAQSNRIPFLTKQLELSFEASDTVARLATETDPAKWKEAQGLLAALLGSPERCRGPGCRGGDGRLTA